MPHSGLPDSGRGVWQVLVAPHPDPCPGWGVCPPAALNIGPWPPLLWRTALTQKRRLPYARGMTHVGVQRPGPLHQEGTTPWKSLHS